MSRNPKPEQRTEREYVVYELEDGSQQVHGGPYSPMKAREVHQAMVNHIRNGQLTGWDIPNDAVTARRVPESEYGKVVL